MGVDEANHCFQTSIKKIINGKKFDNEFTKSMIPRNFLQENYLTFLFEVLMTLTYLLMNPSKFKNNVAKNAPKNDFRIHHCVHYVETYKFFSWQMVLVVVSQVILDVYLFKSRFHQLTYGSQPKIIDKEQFFY